MKWLYVLRLDEGKYYVGTTARKEERVLEHFRNNGSHMTKRYKPVSVKMITNVESEFDEDNMTKRLMRSYGINNVRGGSYSQIILPEYQLKALRTEFATLDNACFRCGRTTHYVNKCYAKTHIDGSNLTEESPLGFIDKVRAWFFGN